MRSGVNLAITIVVVNYKFIQYLAIIMNDLFQAVQGFHDGQDCGVHALGFGTDCRLLNVVRS